jgi:hypothetical protein
MVVYRAKWKAYPTQDLARGQPTNASHPQDDVYIPYIQRVYAEQIAAFRPAVAAADPNGHFSVGWMDEMLGVRQ